MLYKEDQKRKFGLQYGIYIHKPVELSSNKFKVLKFEKVFSAFD